MAGVLIYGIVQGYGFKKTGTLIPWILLLHALSDMFYIGF